MATNEDTNENSTEHVELPTMQASVVMPPKHSKDLEAESIGNGMVRVGATASDCTTLSYMMDTGQARELVSELEDAIATETK
jgi:hypothetical protein